MGFTKLVECLLVPGREWAGLPFYLAYLRSELGRRVSLSVPKKPIPFSVAWASVYSPRDYHSGYRQYNGYSEYTERYRLCLMRG